jgi:ADP-heptose:LPS heptosyltransferase
LTESNLKILIIQFRPAGDVLLLTPVIELLKRRIPDSKIHFLVNEKESSLIRNFHLVDNFILIERIPTKGILSLVRYWINNIKLINQVRREKFDVVIDFIGNPKSAQVSLFSRAPLRIGRRIGLRGLAYNRKVPMLPGNMNTVLRRLSHLRPLGIEPEYIAPKLYLSERDKEFARDYVDALKLRRGRVIVFLAPNSPRISRRWKSDYFVSVGKRLMEEYHAKLLLAWGPGEEEYTQSIVAQIGGDAEMIPPTSLTEMAAIIAHADLMITNCSGTKHMANAVGVRTITIYGPTNPLVWNDLDMERNPALFSDVPCIRCEKRECPREDHICMEGVKPEMVMSEVRRIMESRCR